MFLIYKITNMTNNKMYIGQTSKTINERFTAHIKCANRNVNRYLYDSMNHYGIEKFNIELIEEVQTKNDADDREKYWINRLTTMTPNGYNMTIGGGGGNTVASYSDEERTALYAKQAESRKWYSHNEETRKKISESKIGKELSTEHKNQISETLKKKYKTGEIVAVLPPCRYGSDHHEWTDIDREKLFEMILDGYTIGSLCKYFKCSRPTITTRIKLYFNKTQTELRNEYGIVNRKTLE